MPFRLDPEFANTLFAITGGESPPQTPPLGDVHTRRIHLDGAMQLVNNIAMRPTDVTQEDFYTTATDGHSILLRWYVKSGAILVNSPAVLHLHGGGIIAYNITDYDILVSQFVSLTGVPFLAVEFRNAPEFPYPTPVEDCYAGLLFLHAQASKLGVDNSRIAVMGDSGGGGLAACLANYALAKRVSLIAKQILLYPMLDDRNMIEDPNLVPFQNWNHLDNATAWQAFLGEACGKEGVPVSAAPARLQDATGLPDLYLDACELDIFRDEDIDYALKHAKAGISIELHVHSGVPHAFEIIAPESAVAKRMMADRVRAILSIGSIASTRLHA